jgi:hypothetical protein
MICPKCGSEYREGFTRCGDCNVDLINPEREETGEEEVEFGSPESDVSQDELVEILETPVAGLFGEFTYRLERRQIPYLEQSGTLYAASTGGRRSLHSWYGKVWVPAGFQKDALQVLDNIDPAKLSEAQTRTTDDEE